MPREKQPTEVVCQFCGDTYKAWMPTTRERRECPKCTARKRAHAYRHPPLPIEEVTGEIEKKIWRQVYRGELDGPTGLLMVIFLPEYIEANLCQDQ